MSIKIGQVPKWVYEGFKDEQLKKIEREFYCLLPVLSNVFKNILKCLLTTSFAVV